MISRLILVVAALLFSVTTFAGQYSCTERKGGYASQSVDAVADETPIASAPVPSEPTAPGATEGKILLAGDAPCNPKVTVCED